MDASNLHQPACAIENGDLRSAGDSGEEGSTFFGRQFVNFVSPAVTKKVWSECSWFIFDWIHAGCRMTNKTCPRPASFAHAGFSSQFLFKFSPFNLSNFTSQRDISYSFSFLSIGQRVIGKYFFLPHFSLLWNSLLVILIFPFPFLCRPEELI